MIRPPTWRVVKAVDLLDVAGEEAGLETEAGVVDAAQHVVEIAVGFDSGDGAEGFLADELRIGAGVAGRGGVGQRRGLRGGCHRGFRRQLRRSAHAFGGGEIDEGADIGFFIEGIADDEFFSGCHEQFGGFGGDFFVEINPLHADAGLAGIAEGGGDDAGDGIGEVGFGFEDDCGVVAEFEDDFLFAGLGFHFEADFGGAGEA